MVLVRELLPLGGHHLYDLLVGRPLRRFYTSLVSHIPPGLVLDVGCGPGHLANAMQASGRQVIGLDKDPRQIRIAKRNHPKLDLCPGEAEALPFVDNSFDAVVTSESFHHWQNRRAGLAEAFRVLKPGGQLLVIEGAGDVTRDEVTAFLGHRAPPGLTTIIRWIFSIHGFGPQALAEELVSALDDSPFGGCLVERHHGWWLVRATKPKSV